MNYSKERVLIDTQIYSKSEMVSRCQGLNETQRNKL
jgi:hypothetical protein